MSRIEYKDWAVTSTGDVVGGSAVEVRVQSTGALADLYDAATAGSLLSNPLNAETDGSFVFFVDPGKYDVTVGSGASESTKPLYALRSDITYPTIAAMALAETAAVGDVVSVDDGANGGREEYEATAGGLTADGALVVDGVGVQWVSKRTVYADWAEFIGDARSFADGTSLKQEYEYVTVSGSPHLTLAGGQGVQLVPINNLYQMLGLNPNADGVTDDKAKIDLLNVSGFVVDLGGKDYEYGGVFVAASRFVNGRIIDDNRAYDFHIKTHESASTVGQRRARVNYNQSDEIRVDGIPDKIAMGGFYSFQQYLKSEGRLVSSGLGLSSHTLVPSTSVAGLNTASDQNWYAVFAVASDVEDTCRYVWVPYFRCLSVSTGVVTLARGDVGQNVSPVAKTYDVDTNAFAGTDCLIITEGGKVSRRVATITANTTTTITLDDATGVSQLDYILPAPPSEDSYHYLGTFLFEATNSVKNIADSGYRVNARMSNIEDCPASGSAANVKMRFGGEISPLATGVIGSLNETISTTSLGSLTEQLRHDSSAHDVWRIFHTKEASGSYSFNNMFDAQFSSEQALWLTTGGSLAASIASRSILTYGWYE